MKISDTQRMALENILDGRWSHIPPRTLDPLERKGLIEPTSDRGWFVTTKGHQSLMAASPSSMAEATEASRYAMPSSVEPAPKKTRAAVSAGFTPSATRALDVVSIAMDGLNEQEAAWVLSRLLCGAFGWGLTDQGYEYWRGVERALAGVKMNYSQREADRIDGYDRDDLGESPDY